MKLFTCSVCEKATKMPSVLRVLDWKTDLSICASCTQEVETLPSRTSRFGDFFEAFVSWRVPARWVLRWASWWLQIREEVYLFEAWVKHLLSGHPTPSYWSFRRQIQSEMRRLRDWRGE